MSQKIVSMIDNDYCAALAALAEAQTAKQAAIDLVLTAEIKSKLLEIDDEFSVTLQSAQDKISAIEQQIKDAVAEHGSTVKAESFQAVYSKPRVTWDTKGLDGYLLAHPEIMVFRKEGAPSVSLRATK